MDDIPRHGERWESEPGPRVLHCLLDGPMTMSELSRDADVPAAEVTHVVDALVSAGMLLRHEPHGNGVREVSLSKVGLHAALHGRVLGW